ncbi:MAG: fibronectin type III domain-containing protein [Melioribacteraceae bacterium]
MKNEKTLYRILLLIAAVFLFTFCDPNLNYDYDNTPPSSPENVQTYVGDRQVEITWEENSERDVAGYNIYYSYTYWGEYELIGNTSGNYYVDYDAKNGELYYYAVAAYDFDGNESELSYDMVYGVARPEGMNQSIFDYNLYPNSAGYDFSEFSVVPFDAYSEEVSSDFFFENYNGEYYLNVWDDTDIQDMGYTNSFLDIYYAPLDGWVLINPDENVKYTRAIVGHTYVIWTWDNHFAKVRVKAISNERIIFDWAYQLLEGEQQLKSNRNSETRNKIPNTVIKK